MESTLLEGLTELIKSTDFASFITDLAEILTIHMNRSFEDVVLVADNASIHK